MTPSVSIIVPTRNRAEVLAWCLESLREPTRAGQLLEIIVVDDCSGDRTPEVILEFARRSEAPVCALRQLWPKGANAVRNLALDRIRGEIVVLIGDVIVPSGWLESLSEDWRFRAIRWSPVPFGSPRTGPSSGNIATKFEVAFPRFLPHLLGRTVRLFPSPVTWPLIAGCSTARVLMKLSGLRWRRATSFSARGSGRDSFARPGSGTTSRQLSYVLDPCCGRLGAEAAKVAGGCGSG